MRFLSCLDSWKINIGSQVSPWVYKGAQDVIKISKSPFGRM